jgi:hypothetical protein
MGNVRTKGENFYRYVHHANFVAFWRISVLSAYI